MVERKSEGWDWGGSGRVGVGWGGKRCCCIRQGCVGDGALT